LSKEDTIMNRREFLKTTAVATGAMAVSPLRVVSAKDKPRVKRFQGIGKTGLKMSDISFGTGRLPSSSMVLRAIDRGINYFDTAPDYGSAEKYIGEAMGKIQRDRIIIASKFCTPYSYPSHLPRESSKKDYISAVEDSLSRMKTDYLDFCFVHAIGEQSKNKDQEMKRLLHEEMLSAFRDLKEAGKVRFLSVSSHGPDNMEDLLLAAVAMKTLAGAKDMNFDSGGEEFAPAAFKWVLNHPEVNGLVITIRSVADLELYLTASGETFASSDSRVLDRYAKRYGKEYCRTGCGSCETSCPEEVSIATTLRYQMYFRDYGMEKHAMESYARMQKNAGKCLDCQDEACVDGCPYELPVSSLMREAHRALTMTV
jgi:predicted aldo/keto reductase-like oxidoreductase